MWSWLPYSTGSIQNSKTIIFRFEISYLVFARGFSKAEQNHKPFIIKCNLILDLLIGLTFNKKTEVTAKSESTKKADVIGKRNVKESY